MEKGKACSAGKPRRPREFKSPGAAVARTIAGMAKPIKVAVVLTESGGSQALKVSKKLRGGERVLSRANRFERLSELGDTADLAAGAPNATVDAADLAAGAPHAPAVATNIFAADA